MKVSILIPVYNTERYLRECLDSVVNQTYRDLQVVVVDDGSTDSSLSICEEFSDKYSIIEVYRQENAGVAAARNALLDKAEGEYLLFVDADDWIEPDMIETMLRDIDRYDLDVAICGSVTEHGESRTAVTKYDVKPQIESREEIIKKFILHKDLNGSLWNKLIKTDIIKDLKFAPDIWYGEDALIMWQVFQRVDRVGTVPIPYYHYRMNGDSISHQSFGPKKMSGHKVWRTIYADTSLLWPQYADFAKANFAVSDFWLLVYAAKDKYPQDSNIITFRKNLKQNIRLISRLRLLSLPKIMLAACFILNYEFGGAMMRRSHKI